MSQPSGRHIIPAYDVDSAHDQIHRLYPTAVIHETRLIKGAKGEPIRGTRFYQVTWSVPEVKIPERILDHDRVCACGHLAEDDHSGPNCMIWGCPGGALNEDTWTACNVNGTIRRRYALKRRPIYR